MARLVFTGQSVQLAGDKTVRIVKSIDRQAGTAVLVLPGRGGRAVTARLVELEPIHPEDMIAIDNRHVHN